MSAAPKRTELREIESVRTSLEVALPSPQARIDGILIGQVRWHEGELRVTFPGCPSPEGIPARSMAPLDIADGPADVALMFESGDPRRPCILGRMCTPPAAPLVEYRVDHVFEGKALEDHALEDHAPGAGERLVIRADKEIVFECGEASITLTRAGKVLIRGAYVLSASTGVQRILGATVEIN